MPNKVRTGLMRRISNSTNPSVIKSELIQMTNSFTGMPASHWIPKYETMMITGWWSGRRA
jgi:hypothetical protein